MTEHTIVSDPAAPTAPTMRGDTAVVDHTRAKLNAALKRLTIGSAIRRKSIHGPNVIIGNRNGRAIDACPVDEKGTSRD